MLQVRKANILRFSITIYAERRGRSNLQLDLRNVGSGKQFTHQIPKRVIRIEGSEDHTSSPEPLHVSIVEKIAKLCVDLSTIPDFSGQKGEENCF
jgi:hypothetical protein